jgi:hypothetical protein
MRSSALCRRVDGLGHLKGLIAVDDLLPLLTHEMTKIAALIRHEHAAEIAREPVPAPDPGDVES